MYHHLSVIILCWLKPGCIGTPEVQTKSCISVYLYDISNYICSVLDLFLLSSQVWVQSVLTWPHMCHYALKLRYRWPRRLNHHFCMLSKPNSITKAWCMLSRDTQLPQSSRRTHFVAWCQSVLWLWEGKPTDNKETHGFCTSQPLLNIV